MANNKDFQRFIPLDRDSQIAEADVLFFDSSLPLDYLHQSAMIRCRAATGLARKIRGFEKVHFSIGVTEELALATRLLITDASSVMAHFIKRKIILPRR